MSVSSGSGPRAPRGDNGQFLQITPLEIKSSKIISSLRDSESQPVRRRSTSLSSRSMPSTSIEEPNQISVAQSPTLNTLNININNVNSINTSNSSSSTLPLPLTRTPVVNSRAPPKPINLGNAFVNDNNLPSVPSISQLVSKSPPSHNPLSTSASPPKSPRFLPEIRHKSLSPVQDETKPLALTANNPNLAVILNSIKEGKDGTEDAFTLSKDLEAALSKFDSIPILEISLFASTLIKVIFYTISQAPSSSTLLSSAFYALLRFLCISHSTELQLDGLDEVFSKYISQCPKKMLTLVGPKLIKLANELIVETNQNQERSRHFLSHCNHMIFRVAALSSTASNSKLHDEMAELLVASIDGIVEVQEEYLTQKKGSVVDSNKESRYRNSSTLSLSGFNCPMRERCEDSNSWGDCCENIPLCLMLLHKVYCSEAEEKSDKHKSKKKIKSANKKLADYAQNFFRQLLMIGRSSYFGLRLAARSINKIKEIEDFPHSILLTTLPLLTKNLLEGMALLKENLSLALLDSPTVDNEFKTQCKSALGILYSGISNIDPQKVPSVVVTHLVEYIPTFLDASFHSTTLSNEDLIPPLSECAINILRLTEPDHLTQIINNACTPHAKQLMVIQIISLYSSFLRILAHHPPSIYSSVDKGKHHLVPTLSISSPNKSHNPVINTQQKSPKDLLFTFMEIIQTVQPLISSIPNWYTSSNIPTPQDLKRSDDFNVTLDINASLPLNAPTLFLTFWNSVVTFIPTFLFHVRFVTDLAKNDGTAPDETANQMASVCLLLFELVFNFIGIPSSSFSLIPSNHNSISNSLLLHLPFQSIALQLISDIDSKAQEMGLSILFWVVNNSNNPSSSLTNDFYDHELSASETIHNFYTSAPFISMETLHNTFSDAESKCRNELLSDERTEKIVQFFKHLSQLTYYLSLLNKEELQKTQQKFSSMDHQNDIVDAYLHLSEYYMKINKEELAIHFIDKLASYHVQNQKHVEAGNTLLKLSNVMSVLPNSWKKGDENSRKNVSDVLKEAIKEFEKGGAWKKVVSMYQEMLARYHKEGELYKMALVQLEMAKMYQEIALRNRYPYTPHFFLVVFFGKEYGVASVKYVYVFTKDELVDEELVERHFKKELLANHKNAAMASPDLRSDLLKDSIPNPILEESGKIVFIERLTPSTKGNNDLWHSNFDRFTLKEGEDESTDNLVVTVLEPLPSLRTRVLAKIVRIP